MTERYKWNWMHFKQIQVWWFPVPLIPQQMAQNLENGRSFPSDWMSITITVKKGNCVTFSSK